ncbi:DUF3515 domain-containing protein [Jannaschia sp. R86511]|uniref:DUF3515 domain-containing protein n=1 Tax=Jannaschia sp. R86511 TaxID=3093853 RepID=UPI0036D3CEBD
MPRRPLLRPLPPGRRPGRPGPVGTLLHASLLVGAVLGGSLLLSACSAAVPVQAAPEGGSPGCATVMAALPATLADAPRRDTTGGAGTAAWGDPAILLRCGVEPLGATSQPCVGVPTDDGGEVDWVVLAGDGTGSIVRTYGRVPAVEVEVPGRYGPAPVSVLPGLGEALQAIEPTSVCVD